MSEIGGDRAPSRRRHYREPARTYLSSALLAALLVAGFCLDLGLGGGRAHLAGWIVALVVVVGIDALTVYAARSLRSVTVTATQLRVGDEAIERSAILGVERGVVDGADAILGRTAAEGMPRGCVGLSLHLSDGRHVVVPTRRPQRLAESLRAQLHVPDVRPAEPDELPLLAEIDERAEALFRVAGMDLPALPIELDALHDAKVIFVQGRPPVGFVRVDEVDGLAHVEELAVLPSHMRRGVGSALLSAACGWAAAHGYPAITLITYAEVAWNAPFYAARGFVEVPAGEPLTPELAELRDWERSVGLDALGRRVVMRRDL